MTETLLHRGENKLIDNLSTHDLRGAIPAVTRGVQKEHDKVRAGLIARAAKLDKRGWIPDNWSDDGSLRSATATWTTSEQRETWGDKYVALEAALGELHEDDWYYIWVQDFTDTDVIYCMGGDLLSAPYTIADGGAITIGDSIEVRPISQYVPLDVAQTGVTELASRRPLKEWRKQKVATLKGLERRKFDASDMELRETDDGQWRLTGYACVTGVPYDVGWYEETIERGAFKRTLSESPDVHLLINHAGMPLARTSSGTMTLEERTSPDERGRTGLQVSADLDPEDPDAQSLKRKLDRGDIDQMSFAFQETSPPNWNEDYTKRTISACSIHRGDVSVVNFGANPATSVSIRSQDALAALRRLGSDTFIFAWTEWRDHTLLPLEVRAGKSLSAATMETLTQVLNLVASADEAVDEAQPMLAELMGVPNPDEPEPDTPETEDAPQKNTYVMPDYTTRARERLTMLQAGGR